MLILVEPVMVPPPIVPRDPRIEMGKKNVEGVKKRRDRWANETELRTWLSKSFPYRIWDPRILDIYAVCREMGPLQYFTDRRARNMASNQ